MTTTEAPSAALREQDRRDWQRHPVDVARLVVRLCLLGLVLFLTAVLPGALTNTSADIVSFFARMPEPFRYALVGLAQLAILLIPIVTVGWFLTRRTRAATLLVVGAALVGGIVMVLLTDWLQRAAPPTAITDLPSGSFVRATFPSAGYLAALVAGATTASPMMTARWRRITWAAVWLTVLVRLITATQAPVNLLVTLALGTAVGSAALVIFGSPRRRPGAATLRAGLAAGGFVIDELGDETSERGVRTYEGRAGGEAVDVVYLDRDDRDIELIARVVRSIRVRDVDEQRTSVRPRFRAAQLAESTMMARRAGARVQEVLAVAPTGSDSALIVLGAASASGRTMRQLTVEDISDEALDDAWRQLGRLHAVCIAHRSLTRDNVVVGGGDRVTLLGLDTALLGSSPESRAVDRAELLVTTALSAGTERALDAVVRSVPADDLEATLSFVQLPALPARTRDEAKKPKHLVDDLRGGLADRLGVEQVELAELERISFGKIVSWVGFAVLAFFVLTLVTNWSAIADAMSGIDWVWVGPAVLATLVGTVGGAMSLAGSVVRPIPLGDATVIMFGQSFLNRFTPMNAGGMAMRIRYLQKGGTDVAVSTAAVGLTSLASGIVQVVFIVFFFLWSSTDPRGDVDAAGGGPDFTLVFVFVGAAVVAAIVLALTPKFRRWLVAIVKSTIEKIRHDFGELARMPSKLGLLFGGQAIAKLSTILTFVWACRAFGIDLPFAELGALYLGANTVASAVPTPGGVGAIEAALVFVLTRAGVPEAEAWAATLLFRLINYWLPTIPGYLALRYSERRELV